MEWGFPKKLKNTKKTEKKKTSPSGKKRAAKRRPLQTEQPKRIKR